MIFEKHDAIVTSIADEEKSGRIQVSCVGLMGDEDSVIPMWVEPNFDWGWFYVPDVGETVEIEMVIGSDTDEVRGQTSLDTPDISWRSKRRWTSEEVDGQNVPRPIPSAFLENYGKRRGFVTPAGNTILFDDTEGKERLEIARAGEDTQSLVFDEDGSVILSDSNGQSVSIKKDLLEVVGSDVVNVNASTVNVSADEINLGANADNAVIRGDDFVTHHDAHTHPTAMGPSGAPLIPTPSTALSTISKVE